MAVSQCVVRNLPEGDCEVHGNSKFEFYALYE